ncbi:MAG: ABC transporter ATP-binding protein [Pseudomonadota bacterium]
MKDYASSLKKFWSILSAAERRRALFCLVLMVASGALAGLMVASIVPFLTILADPTSIATNPALAWLKGTLGIASDYGFTLAVGLGTAGFILLAGSVRIAEVTVVERFAAQCGHAFSCAILARYLAQPYEAHLGQRSGDLGANVNAEVTSFVGGYMRPLALVVSACCTITAVITTILLLEPVVAGIVILGFGLAYGTTFALSRAAVRRLGQARARINVERFQIVNEASGGVKDIKLLGREASVLRRFEPVSRETARILTRIAILTQVPGPVVQTVTLAGIVLLAIFIVGPSGDGGTAQLTSVLPTLGLIAFAGQRMLPEVNKLYHNLANLTYSIAALDRVHAGLGGTRTADALSDAIPAPLGLRQNLALEEVSYVYPNADRAGLDHVSLTVAAGERIGIIGTTGAGKTTLADVLLGLLVPRSGRVVVDGVEVSDANRRAWMQTVGYVPQDIFLAAGSVRQNIAFGVPRDEVDEARVQRAAQIARLDHFVRTQLPEGYDTEVGERGVRLSGGQRQRIGIARALYHEASMIMFDEATSALDNVTESEVMQAIEELPGDKTLFIIAHRLSTVRVCDRIVVLQQGRVAGVGTWDELEASNLEFRRIARVE